MEMSGIMNLLFLSNSEITRPLYDWLTLQNREKTILCSERIGVELIKVEEIDYVISYNYYFLIPQDVIDLLGKSIVNLHISYLPWNKGAAPNIWSFLENTPKGVSIHSVDYKLDTGDIFLQKQIECFDECVDTFKTTYESLHREIQCLFRDNWQKLQCGEITPHKQSTGGTYHKKSDLARYESFIRYDVPISIIKEDILRNLSVKNADC